MYLAQCEIYIFRHTESSLLHLRACVRTIAWYFFRYIMYEQGDVLIHQPIKHLINFTTFSHNSDILPCLWPGHYRLCDTSGPRVMCWPMCTILFRLSSCFWWQYQTIAGNNWLHYFMHSSILDHLIWTNLAAHPIRESVLCHIRCFI